MQWQTWQQEQPLLPDHHPRRIYTRQAKLRALARRDHRRIIVVHGVRKLRTPTIHYITVLLSRYGEVDFVALTDCWTLQTMYLDGVRCHSRELRYKQPSTAFVAMKTVAGATAAVSAGSLRDGRTELRFQPMLHTGYPFAGGSTESSDLDNVEADEDDASDAMGDRLAMEEPQDFADWQQSQPPYTEVPPPPGYALFPELATESLLLRASVPPPPAHPPFAQAQLSLNPQAPSFTVPCLVASESLPPNSDPLVDVPEPEAAGRYEPTLLGSASRPPPPVSPKHEASLDFASLDLCEAASCTPEEDLRSAGISQAEAARAVTSVLRLQLIIDGLVRCQQQVERVMPISGTRGFRVVSVMKDSTSAETFLQLVKSLTSGDIFRLTECC